MKAFVQPSGDAKLLVISKQSCTYILDEDIVEDVIGTMLFDDRSNEQDELQTNNAAKRKKLAMKIFVHNEEDELCG